MKLESCPKCGSRLRFSPAHRDCPSCEAPLQRVSEIRARYTPAIAVGAATVLSFVPLWVAVPSLLVVLIWLFHWTLELREC
jgi:hypothetical protein